MTKENINIEAVKEFFMKLQTDILNAIEIVDGNNFLVDSWQRSEGGGGTTCILENGKLFERAGIGFSHVLGSQLPKSATDAHPEITNSKWEAMGVSLVFHPHNPFIPTVHMNVRFFNAHKNNKDTWWFGGGMDLTPYYGFVEDAKHFHNTIKTTLNPFGKKLYPEFKKNCDEYFFLKHRNEPRGIGGIFFDDFNMQGFDFSFDFTKEVGNTFLKAYLPILQKRRNHKFTDKEKQFQQYRRGRYVEFNLLQDRGTLFGIQSKGRVESILMSMPPSVKWEYDFTPKKGSKEEELYSKFLITKDWV
ncbi:oxygen-dependent coproporphyrinogen oxidase [Methylophilaceae bacterium]|jgi:coproporphyrinogen III oxidase|nr:oxygen-dependent coproporphyrinogen oxidase [Nitrosomonadales bacterium]MBT6356071.1 oxygen-dependent coproporphyrinogen oxidase [Nitrosomonadales bacterium]MDA9086280.1 oxygen-dependent coproporphyrinogen oxidase [Methylophilaceae bacterium]MDB2679779.1 oxygen-dependent coproporphyrinogen oxidase [Methylophilaceae bacterium]|tara:strand:- start:1848 stop:2756 length:909 start_codon:yes stop_codon:yes gene_type:complete